MSIYKEQSPAPTGDQPTDDRQKQSNQQVDNSSLTILTPVAKTCTDKAVPTPIKYDFGKIPETLTVLKNWLLWKYELKNNKWTKVPYQVSNQKADSTNDDTWCHYTQAVQAYDTGKFNGIGFAIGDSGLTCIDIDHEDEWPQGDLEQLLAGLNGKYYKELSPSGNGYHLWIKAVKPKGMGCKSKAFHNSLVEVYNADRFITMTGAVVAPYTDVSDAQQELETVFSPLMKTSMAKPNKPQPQVYLGNDDQSVIDIIYKSKQASSFITLHENGQQGDQSSDDLTYMNILAFYAQGNKDQMDRIYRVSAMMRDKWDEMRGAQTYGQMTIDKALDGKSEFYCGRKHIASSADSTKLKMCSDGWVIKPYDLSVKPDLSQDQLALELSEAGFKKDARYVSKYGKWFFYNGVRWEKDERLYSYTAVRDFIRGRAGQLLIWAEYQDKHSENDKKSQIKWASEQAKTLRQAATVNSVESMARSNAELVATVEQFDSDLMLLGTPNGTVDLKTGELLPAERKHWVTKLTAVAPADKGTPAPKWMSFLNRIFDSDKEMIKFIQVIMGYSLTGKTKEQKLFFLFGTGSNGKSVFLNTLFELLGDYAKRASSQTFLSSSSDKHPTDLAQLQGARLVAGSELPAGKGWNEAIIKDLTGGDIISARYMRQDFFEYMPQFALFIAGNHQPSFSGIDEAIRRRVVLIPFTQTIPAHERDPDLPEKLKEEWPAILRWAVDGAVEWHINGLKVPDKVCAASEEYMEDEDTLADFFSENIANVNFSQVLNSDMYQRFTEWQKASGASKAWTQRAMTQAFKERGMVQVKSGARYWQEVRLKPKPSHYHEKYMY